MKRGEVWWVDFSTSVGGEITKKRPAILVSNNASNLHLNRVQVIPLTSQVEKVYPCEAMVHFRGQPHKAMADQIATVSKSRVSNPDGKISATDLRKVEGAIKVQLDLD